MLPSTGSWNGLGDFANASYFGRSGLVTNSYTGNRPNMDQLPLNSLLLQSALDFAGFRSSGNPPGILIPSESSGDPNDDRPPSEDSDELSRSSTLMDEKFTTSERSGSSMNSKMGAKICRVCSDRALGYNFNVVSCESCKAFFRRNALKKKEFRCPFNDSCDVTTLSRRFCQKCRLKKCFQVGMKKEWIMSEEQRLQKRKRIEENRQKRRALAEHMGKIKNEILDAPLDSIIQFSKDPRLEMPQQRQQQLTNAGFSPDSDRVTPPAMVGLGSDFSPPDSIGQVQAPQKQTVEGQTQLTSINATSTRPTLISSAGTIQPGKDTVWKGVKQDGSEIGHFRRYPAQSLESESEESRVVDVKPRPGVIMGGASYGHDPSPFAVSPNMYYTSPLSTDTGPSPFNAPSVSKQSEDPWITIPKAVLVNLINQCHVLQHTSTPTATVPPVVARAERLCFNEGCGHADDLFHCICRCTCGAKRTGIGVGPILVERGVGPEDEEETSVVQEEPHGSCEQSLVETEEQPQPEPEPAVSASSNVNEFNNYEELKLRELFVANQVMNDGPLYGNGNNTTITQANETSCSEGPSNSTGDSNNPMDVIHMTDVCVRRIIKMCKRLSAFKSLCQEDQIALLKGGCTELMILRGVMTYVPEKDSWRPVGWKNQLLSLEVLKTVKGNVYEEHKKFLRSFRDEWRTCDGMMLCLQAIALFNPERANLAHADKVMKEQDVYVNLLKRYLDLIYGAGTVASKEAFQELMERVKQVRRLNDYTATVFLDMNPRDAEPLLIEVFDLK